MTRPANCCRSRPAKALSLHPDSLRYRLRRIVEATGGPAGLARVIAADVGKCEKVGTHVQREGWETLGGDCRMAGRELPAGRHL